MNMSPQEIEALLRVTPDLPENAALLGALEDLLRASAVQKFPFTATAPFFTAGANNNIAALTTSAPFIVFNDAAAPFLITAQSYDCNTLNAARTVSSQVNPNAIVLISDSGSSRQWSDVGVRVSAWFGNGQFPYVLPEPKMIQANSGITVTVTNQDAAAGINLWLHFHGYRLFKLS
jgi:hypothetical protein